MKATFYFAIIAFGVVLVAEALYVEGIIKTGKGFALLVIGLDLLFYPIIGFLTLIYKKLHQG
jgi:hypothetical protein